MTGVFLGILSIAVGVAMIAFLGPGLRRTAQWQNRWPDIGWRFPLWLHGVGWTVTALGFLAFGIWRIVEGIV
jgi:hypothetical protein